MKRSTKIFAISIVIIVSIIIVASPLISFAQGNRIGILANYYGELPIEIEKGRFEPLLILDSSVAMNKIDPTPIVYRNPNGFDKEVNLVMSINKNSTINYQNVVVSVNDKIFHLRDLIVDYDEFYYYFSLGKKNLLAYSSNQDMIRIWLQKESLGLTEESKITFNFIIND